MGGQYAVSQGKYLVKLKFSKKFQFLQQYYTLTHRQPNRATGGGYSKGKL